jgi:hypothetical protein
MRTPPITSIIKKDTFKKKGQGQIDKATTEWCDRIQEQCICDLTCDDCTDRSTCNHVDECSHCADRVKRYNYFKRFDWLSPAHEVNRSGNEKYLCLSTMLARNTTIPAALILTYLHFKLRLSDHREEGLRWFQIPIATFVKELPLSRRTVQTALSYLKRRDLISTRSDGTEHYKGLWYTIYYDKTLLLGAGQDVQNLRY